MTDYKTDDAPLTHDNFFKELSKSIDEPATEAGARVETDIAPLLTFINGYDFMAQVFPDQEWLIESIIPTQGLACLSGMPGAYKSWLGFYLALRILKGEPVLDRWATEKSPVLFIDKENVERQIQERMKMLGAGREMENCYFTQGNFSTENLNSLAATVSFVREKGIKLVIVDSLVRVHSRDENSAVEMNKVFERLAELQHAGAAVLYLHHLNKSTQGNQDPMQRLRGSVDISARLDSLLAVESERNFITVVHGKSRYVQALPSFMMEFAVNKAGKAFFNYVREIEEGQLQGLACEDEVLALLNKGTHSQQRVIEELDGRHSSATVRRALTTLQSQGKVVKHLEDRKAIYSINRLRATVESFLEDKSPE